MIEKFLMLSYFDMHIGPNILYSKICEKEFYEYKAKKAFEDKLI